MRLPDKFGVIVNRAVGGGIRDERAKSRLVELETRPIVDLDLDPERLRSRLDDSNGLRMTIVGDKKSLSIRNGRVTERHRLGGGSGFIEQ